MTDDWNEETSSWVCSATYWMTNPCKKLKEEHTERRRFLEKKKVSRYKVALSPQLFKDPECWSRHDFEPTTSCTGARSWTYCAKQSAVWRKREKETRKFGFERQAEKGEISILKS